jgi:hypothetical protein
LRLGPGDFGAAPERRTSLGARAPALGWGRGGPGIWVGAARERVLLRARAGACFVFFFRARGRALCGPPSARARRRARSRYGYSALGAVVHGQERLPGRAPACDFHLPLSFGARALLLVDGAASRTRRTLLLSQGAAGGLQAREGWGWALPALVTSLDSRGLGLQRNLVALLSGLRLRFSRGGRYC